MTNGDACGNITRSSSWTAGRSDRRAKAWKAGFPVEKTEKKAKKSLTNEKERAKLNKLSARAERLPDVGVPVKRSDEDEKSS